MHDIYLWFLLKGLHKVSDIGKSGAMISDSTLEPYF